MADTYTIIGDKELIEAMTMLGQRAANNIMKPAVSKALTPINREAKSLAPTATKNLRKSIGKRVKRRKDKVVGKITIRKGYAGAAKYAHMVEFGTKHMPARSFMRAAMYNRKQEAMSVLRSTARVNLYKEVDKARANNTVRVGAFGQLRRL